MKKNQAFTLMILNLLCLTSCNDGYDLELRFTNMTSKTVNISNVSGTNFYLYPNEHKTYQSIKINKDEESFYAQMPSVFSDLGDTMTFVFSDKKKIVFPNYSDVDTIQTYNYDWNFGNKIFQDKKQMIYDFRITESDYQKAK
jgi:hypothetical protein